MAERKITIEQVESGYIVTTYPTLGMEREVFTTLDEVFEELLSQFEGRYPGWHGDRYGRVVIHRDEPAIMDGGAFVCSGLLSTDISSASLSTDKYP